MQVCRSLTHQAADEPMQLTGTSLQTRLRSSRQNDRAERKLSLNKGWARGAVSCHAQDVVEVAEGPVNSALVLHLTIVLNHTHHLPGGGLGGALPRAGRC